MAFSSRAPKNGCLRAYVESRYKVARILSPHRSSPVTLATTRAVCSLNQDSTPFTGVPSSSRKAAHGRRRNDSLAYTMSVYGEQSTIKDAPSVFHRSNNTADQVAPAAVIARPSTDGAAVRSEKKVRSGSPSLSMNEFAVYGMTRTQSAPSHSGRKEGPYGARKERKKRKEMISLHVTSQETPSQGPVFVRSRSLCWAAETPSQ